MPRVRLLRMMVATATMRKVDMIDDIAKSLNYSYTERECSRKQEIERE